MQLCYLYNQMCEKNIRATKAGYPCHAWETDHSSPLAGRHTFLMLLALQQSHTHADTRGCALPPVVIEIPFTPPLLSLRWSGSMKWPDAVIKRGNEISLRLDCHTTALITYVQLCASADGAAKHLCW